MATESLSKSPWSVHSGLPMSENHASCSSGSQQIKSLDIVNDSIRSIASMPPFVDYNSLVEYVAAAGIEIIPFTELQITGIKLGAGAYMAVFRGSCVERFGELSLAIKRINIPLPRGSSDLVKCAEELMHQLSVISLEVRVLSDRLLRTHPNIVRLLGISFEEICKPAEDNSDNEFFKPILILEEAHHKHPTLEKFYDLAKSQGHEISTDTKVALLSDVADALSAVHSVGVVHGDIKPANVLLFGNSSSRKLVAKLSDFGGCQLADDSDAATRFELLGTEYWNAPEAYDNHHPHYRSKFRDIYSFGLLGYFILFESHLFGCPGSWTLDQSEALRQFKLNWKSLSCQIIAKLRQQWPHVVTKAALKQLQSLPQVTDLNSLRARLVAYRQYSKTGDVDIGVRTSPSTTNGLFGIRHSKNLDYRPFAMTLALTLFIHTEPEKRDPYDLLGNLSIFLNDQDIARNLRDICGSEGWHYILGRIVENKFLPWQLTDISKYPLPDHKPRISWIFEPQEKSKSSSLLELHQLHSLPKSLRYILKTEYEKLLDNCASNERIQILETLGSLNIDSASKFLSYNLQAAQLGSRSARGFFARLGSVFVTAPNQRQPQEFDRWMLETTLPFMPELDSFLDRLEETCPWILKSNEILMPLMPETGDSHFLSDEDYYSLWIPNPSQTPSDPTLLALQAVVGKDIWGLRQTIATYINVLDMRFATGDTLLHVAAELDRAMILVMLVNEYEMDVDLENSAAVTPLITAAIHDCHHAMDALLNLRAEYKRILSARITVYLANLSRSSMITRLVALRDTLEQEWPLLLGVERACPSVVELLDGNFSFFDDHMPESEPIFAPIFAAILGNNLSALEELLRYGCSHDAWATFAAPFKVRMAPIHLACQLRPLHLAILLHYGANLNLVTDDELRHTPLHFACTAVRQPCYNYPYSKFDSESADPSPELIADTRLCMLRLLVSYGLTNFDAQDALGKTALHHCVRLQGCLPVMKALITDYQADPEIQDVELMTPLHHVVAKTEQDHAYLDVLLSETSNDTLHQPDVNGDTPLMWAVSVQRGKHNIEICKCLILRGSSLCLQNRYGATILHLAIDEPGDYELFLYVYHEIMRRDLLPELSCLVDGHGRTFAHSMARSKNLRIRHHLRYLPFKILGELINKTDLAGFTMLHEATLIDDPELVRILLENGANADQLATYNLSSLDIARGAGNFAIVELLQYKTGSAPGNENTWTSDRWAMIMNELKKKEEAREQSVLDEIVARVEDRKQLFKARRPWDGGKKAICSEG